MLHILWLILKFILIILGILLGLLLLAVLLVLFCPVRYKVSVVKTEGDWNQIEGEGVVVARACSEFCREDCLLHAVDGDGVRLRLCLLRQGEERDEQRGDGAERVLQAGGAARGCGVWMCHVVEC